MLMQQPSFAPPQAPQAQIPGPQGPQPAATQMNAAGNPSQVTQPSTPMGAQAVQQKASQIQAPQPPQNPLTGQRTPLPGSQT